MKQNPSRREFLRNALGMAIVSTAAPGVLLGHVLPTLRRTPSGKLLGLYSIKLRDYPLLMEVGGSIMLTSPHELTLNLEHRTYNDDALYFGDKRRGRYPIAVTRIKKENVVDAFCAVSTYCKRGSGYQVRYDVTSSNFICTHEKATYTACGKWIPTPDGPDLSDPKLYPDPNLLYFPTSFDGETITFEEPLLGVEEPERTPLGLALEQNYPNPVAASTTISYRLPRATYVLLKLYALDGSQVKVLVAQDQSAGTHHFDLSAEDLHSGEYLYKLQTLQGSLSRRMTVLK